MCTVIAEGDTRYSQCIAYEGMESQMYTYEYLCISGYTYKRTFGLYMYAQYVYK